MPELICKILHISKTTYYSYLKKDYPIVKFLTSLSKNELEYLSKTGEIKKLELIKDLSLEDLESFKEFKNKMLLEEIERTENKLKTLKSQLNVG